MQYAERVERGFQLRRLIKINTHHINEYLADLPFNDSDKARHGIAAAKRAQIKIWTEENAAAQAELDELDLDASTKKHHAMLAEADAYELLDEEAQEVERNRPKRSGGSKRRARRSRRAGRSRRARRSRRSRK